MVMAVMQMQMQTMAVLDILMLSRKVQAPHVKKKKGTTRKAMIIMRKMVTA